MLIGIGIIGDGWFDKDIGPLDNRIVFTEKRAINRETLIIYSPVCANRLVPAYKEFVSLTVECGGGSIDKQRCLKTRTGSGSGHGVSHTAHPEDATYIFPRRAGFLRNRI